MPRRMYAYWCLVVVLAAVNSAAEGFQQTKDTNLRISRGEFRKHLDAFDFNENMSLLAESIFNNYQAEYNRSLEAKNQLVAWIYSHDAWHYGADDPALTSLLSSDELSIHGRWQLVARKLEDRYFELLSSLTNDSVGVADSLRRAHLRTRLLSKDTLPADTPFGVALDVIALVQATVPAAVEQPGIVELLTDYEIRLDPVLRALDRYLWQYRKDQIEATLNLNDLLTNESSTETEVAQAIDVLIEVYTRAHVLCFDIRTLNKATLQQLIERISGELAIDLSEKGSRRLFGYMYDAETPSPDVMIRDALRRIRLTAKQRADLNNIRLAFEEERRSAAARLDLLYDQLISPEARRARYRAWIHTIYLKDSIASSDDSAREAFQEAVRRWSTTQAAYQQQVQSTLAAGSE